jgi:hypothetical protein
MKFGGRLAQLEFLEEPPATRDGDAAECRMDPVAYLRALVILLDAGRLTSE